MRIDAHIHYTPPELAADLAAFVEEEPFWGLMVAGEKSLQGWATIERTVDDMDRAGVDRAVLLGEYRQRHDGCVARNDQALAIVRRYPGRFSGFAVLQPKAGRAALDELERCLDGGLTGVGELGPHGQGFRLDDPDFLRVVEACIRRDVPLNLHANDEVGAYYPGRGATPLADYYRLACRYPELKLILAHWGGGLLFSELMPEVRSNLANVWYDTAATPLVYRTARLMAAALACVDHRKLLYGSDYPLLIYPQRQSEPDMRPFLAELDALDLAPDVRADLMGGNAARLLGLAPAPAAHEARAAVRWRRPVLSEIDPHAFAAVTSAMTVSAVAQAWPDTQAIFERHGIPWEDHRVPYWEPISQAAAVRGYGPAALGRLLAELTEAVAGRPDAAQKEGA